MNPAGFWIGVIAIVTLVTLVIIDVVRTPAPVQGRCTLATRIVLPDICVNSCPSSGVDVCTVATRPYAVFFTQASKCADAVIC